MNTEFLTLKEVAEILKVTPVHVQNLIHSGKLKGYKFGNGRGMRVQMTDLIDYVGGCKVISQEQIDMATNYHERAMNRATANKINIMQAVEELRAEDPQGYKVFMNLTGIGRVTGGELRFDNPSCAIASGTVAPSVPGAGGDFEAAVDRIMKRENCKECEAVQILLADPQGKILFEKYWSAAMERSYAKR